LQQFRTEVSVAGTETGFQSTASREGFRPIKLLSKQIATGGLLTRPGPDVKVRLAESKSTSHGRINHVHRPEERRLILQLLNF
jgi:hypothetical protein